MLGGKTFAVTGGTGALGGAVVRDLLATGANVAVVGGREASVARLVGELDAGERVGGFPADLTDEGQVGAAFAAAAGRFGGLDGLVAAAGGFGGGTPVHETDVATWREQYEVNLLTSFLACRATIPHLLERGGGAIVTVASRPALHGAPYIAAYSVAKGGVLRLTEALAGELKDRDVTVNAILPSTIDTPANRAASPDADYSAWVAPEAIAAVVRWLLGPDARIVSGAAIPVYGRA
jgi:NAD(P)-dependent dehydrogenase (short-subunit alcohol dehydrogenase family)